VVVYIRVVLLLQVVTEAVELVVVMFMLQLQVLPIQVVEAVRQVMIVRVDQEQQVVQAL